VLFNTLEFWVFFGVFFALYRRFSRLGQNRLLLVASYIFYGSWDWRFLGLLAFTTLVDWYAALRIEGSPTRAAGKRWLTLSIVTNLSVLGFFKYYDFFAESLIHLAARGGLTLDPPLLHVILPVGISFYTFQSMSYTIDVFRGRVRATPSLFEFAVYTSFFPQLVAGPIERGWHMLPQVRSDRLITRKGIEEGLYLISWGLFKKVFVADNLAEIVETVYGAPAPADALTTLIAVYAFAFQIYCDFSGYTDIARGLARTMGFELLLNFNLPYLAVNPSDFWRRWHISLSTWLRDYLYVPLGGNRKGTARTYANLMITMLLGGLWHGAAWTFVIWGAYHGLLLCAHRALAPALAVFGSARRGLPRAASRAARTLVMFHLVCLGWIPFRADSLDQVGRIFSGLASGFVWTERGGYFLARMALFVGFLVIAEFIQAARQDLLALHRVREPWARATLYLYLYCSIVFLGNLGGQQFIYFQF
jgi:D-alanyl-lipoteichoic acid acyltransferase DltB (MBOAT superfamily)